MPAVTWNSNSNFTLKLYLVGYWAGSNGALSLNAYYDQVLKEKYCIMYLLTEWESRTRKYLARGQGVRTERSELRTSCQRFKYFFVRLDLTQSISILSYDHLLLKILFEPK